MPLCFDSYILKFMDWWKDENCFPMNNFFPQCAR